VSQIWVFKYKFSNVSHMWVKCKFSNISFQMWVRCESNVSFSISVFECESHVSQMCVFQCRFLNVRQMWFLYKYQVPSTENFPQKDHYQNYFRKKKIFSGLEMRTNIDSCTNLVPNTSKFLFWYLYRVPSTTKIEFWYKHQVPSTENFPQKDDYQN